jgi:vacuolar protein sorting-associated protein 26
MDMLSSLLSKPPSIKVVFEQDREKTIMKNTRGDLVEYAMYYDTDPVKGKVVVQLNKNKNFEHNGIKVELIGVIENYKEKTKSSRFIALTRDLEAPGQLNNEITHFDFEFSNVEKQYETYKGKNVCVKYFLQTTMSSKYKGVVHEAEFVVFKPKSLSDLQKDNKPQIIEVGIEDWIHVSFEVDKSKFFLRDCIEGQVVFRKVSVRLDSMDIQLVRRETIGSGKSNFFIFRS